MDLTLLVLLILLNGLFAMSEMALTASRKARLTVMVESGEPGAQAAARVLLEVASLSEPRPKPSG